MKAANTIGLIGIGIFLCLTLQGISALVSEILEEALLFMNLNPLLTYGLSEYITLACILIIFISLIEKFKKQDYTQTHMIKRVFLLSVFAYITTQVLGFAQPFVSTLYQDLAYFDLRDTYHNGLNEHQLLKSLAIEIPVWILQYGIIAVLIHQKLVGQVSQNSKTPT